MAKLILLNPQGGTQSFELTAELVKLGRSADCQICFDSNTFRGVSRYHATLTPSHTQWQLCDQNSANGTFVNDQPINGCVTLRQGDRIMLSQNGPQLLFETAVSSPPHYQSVNQNDEGRNPNEKPVNQESPTPVFSSRTPPVANTATPSLSQLIPVVSSSRNLKTFWTKGYILPGILTVSLVVLLFFSRGNLELFLVLLGTYLGAIGYSFIYRLCGKSKPWWEIAIAILMTMLLLMIPPFLGLFFFIFRTILPGNVESASGGFINLFIAHFFGAGLAEELLKALPVFLLMYLGNRAYRPKGKRSIGVREPLDGIVLAAASGLGFTLVETLVQYVPDEILRVANALGGTPDALQAGQLLGLQLLFPRIIGSLAGHMAYSGYFGYCIGLSVLFPQRKWLILSMGYLTSSILHALWNATGGTLGPVFLALAGILSYVFLIAAILKARELSPTRSQNFATRLEPPDSYPP